MEVGVRLLGAVGLILSWLIWPYYLLLSLRKSPRLPPIKSDILTSSASLLAFKIRHKMVKCEDVINVFIERCREVNPLLNAIVEERFREALIEAKRVDSFLEKESISTEQIEKEYPFLGVPFTVKESCGLKGLSHSVGSKLRKGVIASANGDSVEKMMRSGAIPISLTNTPELCLSFETNNLLTGVTCNPYNIFRTSGGSSGGEAALISAAASVIGIGSDIAGSIRIPAMFCGIYGHKPTPGYVSIEGHYPNSSDKDFSRFLVVGPMTRYAEDLKPMLKVLAGEKGKELNLDNEVNIPDINVYFKEEAGFSFVTEQVDKDIKRCLSEAVQYLELAYGCKTSRADLSELSEIEISLSVFFGMEGIPDLLSLSSNIKKPNLYMELLKSIVGCSEFSLQALVFMFIVKHNAFVPKHKYHRYLEENQKLKEKINSMLSDNGVLLYPTFPIPALYHNGYLVKPSGLMYPMIFNTLELPATHVPLGLNSNHLPIGIQVVAAQGQDRLCLAIAEALEKKFVGWIPPPNSLEE